MGCAPDPRAAGKTETHGEGRGGRDCLQVQECPGFLAATGSQEREERKDPLPQSLHSEGGWSWGHPDVRLRVSRAERK